MKPGEVVDVPGLGVRFALISVSPEQCTFEVTGRPRGLLRGPHVHEAQHERIEVLSGRLRVGGRVLSAGDAIDIPPGARHTQTPVGRGEGTVRVTHRPAGRTVDFLAALSALKLNRLGYPPPAAGARFIRDFGADHHGAFPPLRLQQAFARALDPSYEFVDEWDVAAPIEDVFDALADGTTYPQWWKPVYLSASVEGDETVQHFKGRLPYHLHTRTRTVRSERPFALEGVTEGDLRGRGVWTLSPIEDGGTHVRFDWQVHADRPLLRWLTPVLRPALRWNHNWAIARAIEGLEPYILSRATVAA